MYKFIILISLISIISCNTRNQSENSKSVRKEISGKVIKGIRHIDLSADLLSLKVYRGDYIAPFLNGSENFSFKIPELGINKEFPTLTGERTYVQVKEPMLKLKNLVLLTFILTIKRV